jgi:hypothetical protein
VELCDIYPHAAFASLDEAERVCRVGNVVGRLVARREQLMRGGYVPPEFFEVDTIRPKDGGPACFYVIPTTFYPGITRILEDACARAGVPRARINTGDGLVG